jgi:hypothetical protein
MIARGSKIVSVRIEICHPWLRSFQYFCYGHRAFDFIFHTTLLCEEIRSDLVAFRAQLFLRVSYTSFREVG